LVCWPAAAPVTFAEKVHVAPEASDAPVKLTALLPAAAVIVPPPHDPVRPFGVAITKPDGRVSVNPTPESVCVVLLFCNEKDSEVDPFRGMLVAPNALLMLGGPMTVIEAVLLAAPGPLSVEEIGPVVLFWTPACTPFTFTEMVHDPLGANPPPERLTEPDPAVPMTVPPQVLLRPLGVATTSPAGSASVNATPVSASVVLGLLIWKVSDVVAFAWMLAAPNALVMVGALATVSVAVLLVAPIPPFVELTAPVVFDTVPDCVPVTFTTIVHVVPGVAILPPVRLMLVLFAAAVTVPPQLLVTPGVLATCNPLVSVSLKAIPFSALVLAAGLVIVKVTVVVPFSEMLAAPNALLIVGGATTFTVAVLLDRPVPPSVELIAPAVLLASPATVPVTLTVSVQEAL